MMFVRITCLQLSPLSQPAIIHMASTITLFSLSLRILTLGGSSVTESDRKVTLANLATFTLGQFASCSSASFLLPSRPQVQLLFHRWGKHVRRTSTIRIKFWHALTGVHLNVYYLRPTVRTHTSFTMTPTATSPQPSPHHHHRLLPAVFTSSLCVSEQWVWLGKI